MTNKQKCPYADCFGNDHGKCVVLEDCTEFAVKELPPETCPFYKTTKQDYEELLGAYTRLMQNHADVAKVKTVLDEIRRLKKKMGGDEQ